MLAKKPPLQFVIQIMLVAATTSSCLYRAGDQTLPRARNELQNLAPYISEVCEPVRQDVGLWPFRSFPYGPLGLEVRRARTAIEADNTRNYALGMAAAACGIPSQRVTGYFFCGPDCTRNRRDHLAKQLVSIRRTLAAFEAFPEIRLISIWAPRGEVRINDLYLIDGTAREAIPSPEMGLVPSGNWRHWSSLGSYLSTKKAQEKDIEALTGQMRDIGLSALIKDANGTRAVGVGVGDNESGLLFATPNDPLPRVGEKLLDGRQYSIVEQVGLNVFFYETN